MRCTVTRVKRTIALVTWNDNVIIRLPFQFVLWMPSLISQRQWFGLLLMKRFSERHVLNRKLSRPVMISIVERDGLHCSHRCKESCKHLKQILSFSINDKSHIYLCWKVDGKVFNRNDHHCLTGKSIHSKIDSISENCQKIHGKSTSVTVP